MSERTELIESAVRFLQDPKVKEAPLAKKVSFLESKGMTSQEIQTALNQVNGTPVQTIAQSSQPPPLPPKPQVIIQQAGTSWKTLLVGASILGGLGGGIYYLSKKYLLPLIDFPTAEALKEETKVIQETLQKSQDETKKLAAQTDEIARSMEEHTKQVTTDLLEINSLVNNLMENEKKRNSDIAIILAELNELKSTFPKLAERNKEGREMMLKELQSEIKSLKGLLNTRRNLGEGDGAAKTIAGVSIGQPKIPEWQLAAANAAKKEQETKVEESADVEENEVQSGSHQMSI